MAIKSNKKVDFEFEYESPTGTAYAISLRFFHTDEYGPTIALLDDEGEPAVSFPVTMFSEVSEFLVEQGILQGKKTLPMPNRLPNITNTMTKATETQARKPLPKPRVVNTRPNSQAVVNPLKVGNRKSPVEAVEVDLEDDSPAEQPFLPEDLVKKEAKRMEDISNGIEGMIPAQSLSSSADQVELSQEEVQDIMAAREKALRKAQTAGASIRRAEK